MERAARLCLLLGLLVLVVPVVLVPVPPLLDLPNHVARLHLLVDAVVEGREHPFFAVDWTHAMVNTPVDALGVAIGAVIGAGAAGSVLCALALVLPPLGAALLNRALFGGWHWWMAAFPMLAWNGSLLLGFISFQIGAGLALLAAAWDHGVVRRWAPLPRLAARAMATAVLLFVHPFAAAFFALLLGGLVLGRGVGGWGGLPRRIPWVLATGVACLLPVLLYLALTPTPPVSELPEATVGAPGRGGLAGHLHHGFTVLMGGLSTYDRTFEWVWLLPLWGVAAASVWMGRGMRGHAGVLLVAGVLAVVAATMPVYVVGNAASNWRLAALVGLTMVAGCRPAAPFPVRPGAAAALAGALLVVGALRTAWVGTVWWPARADLRAVEAALARVPPGSAVLPVEHAPDLARAAAVAPHRVFVGGTPLYWHLAALAVPRRDAFVPTLFTGRGKQPVRPRPPWDSLAVPHGPPPSIHALALPGDVLRERLAADPKLYLWRYLAHWREDFGYVLVLNADQPDQAGPVPPIAGLDLVADEGFAQLWRIRPVPAPPEGGVRGGIGGS